MDASENGTASLFPQFPQFPQEQDYSLGVLNDIVEGDDTDRGMGEVQIARGSSLIVADDEEETGLGTAVTGQAKAANGADAVTLSDDDKSPSLPLCNDDGAPVTFGEERTDMIYCGRRLGVTNIPGSDGRCGPSNGPHCRSCMRFLNGPRRADVLLRMFLSIGRSTAVAALRKKGGGLDTAARFLAEKGATGVEPLHYALPPLPPTDDGVGRSADVDPDEAQRLVEILGLGLAEAEAALRRNPDLQRAAAWIYEDPDKVDVAVAEDREHADRVVEAEITGMAERLEALRTARRAEIPDDVAEMGVVCCDFPGLGGADAVIIDGHRMVAAVKSCILCTSAVPSPEGGSCVCELCGLCEGCVRSTPPVVLRCPQLRNGSHLHVHSLSFDLDRRRNCYCDVGGRSCGDVIWSCDLCDFDVCAICISRPAPDGYDRLAGAIDGQRQRDNDDEDEEDGDNSDDDSENSDTSADMVPDNLRTRPFDAIATERRAAARWETPQEGASAGDVIVGGGETGNSIVMTPSRELRGAEDQQEARRRLKGEASSLTETKLAEEAEEALSLFQSGGKSEPGGYVVSATDLTHAEDLLHRARAVASDPFMHREVCHAIASGRIDLAGSLLLSDAYAPILAKSCGVGSTNGFIEGSGDDAVTRAAECWCGEVINDDTAPDGVVGCLSGHAMHPSCAADLLLSGGSCPACRLPLHFPRVPEVEARSAVELVNAEMRRSQERDQKISGDKDEVKVHEFVQICADREECAKSQMDDPRAGGWADDMAEACGKVGRITEVVKLDLKVIAVKIRTKGLDHSYEAIRRGSDYRCKSCGMYGPSPETGRRRCVRCSQCETCCSRIRDRPCPPTCHEWTWAPTLLRPTSAAFPDTSLLDPEEAAAREAERHIMRLRAELKVISACREVLKDKCEIFELSNLLQQQKNLSNGSTEALSKLWGKVSFADWVRGRHLLSLAQKWGDSKDAKMERVVLCNAVQDCDLDTVARIVRRSNALRMAERLRWEDAIRPTSGYCVAPTAKVDLRAFPASFAPKTGFVLHPETRFQSRRELLDNIGNLWLQVDYKSFPGAGKFDGKVVADLRDQMTSHAVVGARVRRGPDWKWNDQDGGEKNEGVIVQVIRSGKVSVRWVAGAKQYEYRAGDGHHDLVFAGAAPQPPQGWLCVRPAGLGTPAVAWRAMSALRCFCCGDGLIPPKLERGKYTSIKGRDVQEGERLLVAATLEPVIVTQAKNRGRIRCAFESNETNEINIESDGFDVWYRPEDLVSTQSKGDVFDDEMLRIKGQPRTRREIVLMSGGDELTAKREWAEAKKLSKLLKKPKDDGSLNFASCVRGHFLHARCLQGALLSGGLCPAIGCNEPLCVPRVKLQHNDDSCCGGGASSGEEENRESEFQTAAESFIQHSQPDSTEGPDGEEITSAGLPNLKMCPACCSGPLINQNCSDMKAHHGECSRVAIRGTGENEATCTLDGVFRVTSVDIAEKIKHMSSTEFVTSILPKCPTHNVPVMFNGCLSCGHLFTDTDWDEMPKWDPKAKGLLELDHKKRKASDLLAKQVRVEVALLRFERDQFDSVMSCHNQNNCAADDSTAESIYLPPFPPPAAKYNGHGCGPSCDLQHFQDRDCLVCGRSWGVHSGHTCPGRIARGSWTVR